MPTPRWLYLPLLLISIPNISGANTTWNRYLPAFRAFTKYHNPWITPADQLKLAETNWILAQGDWKLLRRLAAEEAQECQFRVAAYLPDGTPLLKIPRADCLGSHYNLLAQEAHKLGTPVYKNWYYSDEFDHLKSKCTEDPAFGTWIVGHAYVRKAKALGLDRASHWWQTGETSKPAKDDQYVSDIHTHEQRFDSLVPGHKPQVPRKKIRRKR